MSSGLLQLAAIIGHSNTENQMHSVGRTVRYSSPIEPSALVSTFLNRAFCCHLSFILPELFGCSISLRKLTHTPPLDIFDRMTEGTFAGCALLDRLPDLGPGPCHGRHP